MEIDLEMEEEKQSSFTYKQLFNFKNLNKQFSFEQLETKDAYKFIGLCLIATEKPMKFAKTYF